MPKTLHRREREQSWRDTIVAWKESGQSVTAFCAARGLGADLADLLPDPWAKTHGEALRRAG